MNDNTFQTLGMLTGKDNEVFDVVDNSGKVLFTDIKYGNAADYCLAVNDRWGEGEVMLKIRYTS